ncbi:MAG: RidA family protein, partial [Gemmatimonadota bacterium]
MTKIDRLSYCGVTGATLLLTLAGASAGAQATPPEKVDFIAGARSPIASSVAIPANAAWVWTSGTVPSVADTSA